MNSLHLEDVLLEEEGCNSLRAMEAAQKNLDVPNMRDMRSKNRSHFPDLNQNQSHADKYKVRVSDVDKVSMSSATTLKSMVHQDSRISRVQQHDGLKTIGEEDRSEEERLDSSPHPDQPGPDSEYTNTIKRPKSYRIERQDNNLLNKLGLGLKGRIGSQQAVISQFDLPEKQSTDLYHVFNRVYEVPRTPIAVTISHDEYKRSKKEWQVEAFAVQKFLAGNEPAIREAAARPNAFYHTQDVQSEHDQDKFVGSDVRQGHIARYHRMLHDTSREVDGQEQFFIRMMEQITCTFPDMITLLESTSLNVKRFSKKARSRQKERHLIKPLQSVDIACFESNYFFI